MDRLCNESVYHCVFDKEMHTTPKRVKRKWVKYTHLRLRCVYWKKIIESGIFQEDRAQENYPINLRI